MVAWAPHSAALAAADPAAELFLSLDMLRGVLPSEPVSSVARGTPQRPLFHTPAQHSSCMFFVLSDTGSTTHKLVGAVHLCTAPRPFQLDGCMVPFRVLFFPIINL